MMHVCISINHDHVHELHTYKNDDYVCLPYDTTTWLGKKKKNNNTCKKKRNTNDYFVSNVATRLATPCKYTAKCDTLNVIWFSHYDI